jgi:NitT/TauT family transport system permease protein
MSVRTNVDTGAGANVGMGIGTNAGSTSGNSTSVDSSSAKLAGLTRHRKAPTRKVREKRLATAREILRMLLPAVALCLSYALTTMLPDIYPEGYVMEYYPPFLLGVLGIYLLLMITAAFVAPLRAKLIHYSALIAAVFLLVEAGDLLTLKSGVMILPFSPSPDRVLGVFPKSAELLLVNLGASMMLLAEGVLIGLITGFITGTLMGWSKIANYWFAPLLKVIGPVPSAAWLPIAIALMPTSHLAGVFLISLAVWFPLSLLLSSSIRSTDKRKIEAARVLGASEAYILFHVALPAAIPDIFMALFMGLSSSFGALIISEQLGVKAGLGWYITWATTWGEYNKVFASVAIFIVIFYVLINLLFRIRDHVMKWQKSVVRW